MADYKIFKETTLPGTLAANSIYLVAPAARPDYVEMYVTGTSPSVVKRIVNSVDVQTMISAAMAGSGATTVVADIAARDALTPVSGTTVLVRDASADATVAAGAATYIYDSSVPEWVKVSEYESLDLTLTWANITGKPTSSAAAIDTAVANSHTHANKTQLDKISEDGDGHMTYNGASPKISWDSKGW